MIHEGLTGLAPQSTSNAQPQLLPSGALFLANNIPAFPFVATPQNLERVVEFIHNFPLAVTWNMTDNDVMNYVLSPGVVFIEIDNALMMIDEINPGLSAHSGFLFWDRKVSGNEQLLKDAYRNVANMFQLERIQCNVPSLNRIMYRMLEKIGFKLEGRLRNAFRVRDGRLIDTMIYGALPGELA